MRDMIQTALDEMSAETDRRTSIMEVQVEKIEGDSVYLTGCVLEPAQIDWLRESLLQRFAGLEFVTESVRALGGPGLPCVHVATNLTGLYEKPTFDVRLASELYYGTELDLLEERERWARVRQHDGYLGWAYRPFLEEGHAPQPTHLVMAASVELWNQPGLHGTIMTRVVSGTGVTVERTGAGWALVSANKRGWMPAGLLRSVKDFPRTVEGRRRSMIRDAGEMIGTPYLWGGMSGNGIDCSGLAHLLHRWIGIHIPRDADMQHAAARPVEAPFQVGDLFFFGEVSASRNVTHVGICMGDSMLIHSSRTRNGVYMDDLEKADYLRNIYISAGSFLR
ncbi:MAG: NlpC/P60 family protein [Bacteroidota bacterium]